MFQKITSKSSPEPAKAPTPVAPAPQAAPQPQAPAPQQQVAPQQQQAPVAQSTAGAGSAAAASSQRNILSNDVHIKGTVRFANDLLVDGRIEGEISSEGSLTVAENAHIKAEIKTKSVVVYGKVHGNIIATDRVEIKSSAEMVGDIKGAVLSIEPGAIFVGKSEVGAPSAAPQKAESKPAGGNKGAGNRSAAAAPKK